MKETILYSLKRSREVAGLTQKEVEKALGMRSLMIKDYESGRLKLPVTVAIKLSDLYKVSVDDLLGQSNKANINTSKVLQNFQTLFLGNGFSIMFLDPILRAFLEDHQDKYFQFSLFELLTGKKSENQKKEIVTEISRVLFSLASSDGKVSDSEIDCIRYILSAFEIENKYKEVSVGISEVYYPSSEKILTEIELRHFIIWILFFFAYADKKLTFEEIEYIEKCAESLKINRSNFLFIKEKFIKEKLG